MKTLYLHIGTPKTATTAIQNFCLDNQKLLAQKGYYYPTFEYTFPNVGQYRNAHFLVAQLWDENKNRDYDKEENIANDGLEKLLQFFQRYDNIILSDEKIWFRGFIGDTHCWKRLQEHIISKGITIKVIVYLRRQDEYLFSWWGQRIKTGRKYSTLSWSEITEKLPHIQLDYYQMLEQIATVVGKENITVRIFDKKAFFSHSSEGSIFSDFLNALHLEYTKEYSISNSTKNLSLTKNNIEIKRLLNMLPEFDTDGNKLFSNAMKNLASDNPSDRQKSMFSKEDNERFLETYREGNMQIAKEYLGLDEDIFEYSYHANEQWSWNDDKLSADIINFFGSTTLHLLQEIRKSEQRMQKLEQRVRTQEQHINNLRYKLKHPAKAVAHKLYQYKELSKRQYENKS